MVSKFFFKCVFQFCTLFLLLRFCQIFCDSQFDKNLDVPTISLKNSKVSGPGLVANFTVPVRYFYIQLLDVNLERFISAPESLTVQVSGLNNKCHIWYQLLHMENGLFIARYRLYETCLGVKIDVMYENESVGRSPYVIEGVLFQEQCYCPQPMEDWLSALECPSSFPQIQRDLSFFPEVDMEIALEDALMRFNHPSSYSFCHYSLISNQVYRKCFGQYVGFSMFMDEILLSLTRKMHLPDLELIANLGDWPLEQKSESPIPIFSWCGSKFTRDIVMPTYDITESTLEMMGRVMLDILSVKGNSGPAWEEKHKIGFWRGRDSSKERLELIKLGRKYPHLINASLVNFFFFRKEEAEYGPKTDYISFFDFFKYRYQITVDGTVAAYRLPYLLAGQSVVLKQESEYYEHFYNDLEPMVHYIPFKKDLSDLVEKLQWASDHDSEAKKIAENAQEYTSSNLMPRDILCYYTVLLKEYSKRLKKRPKVHENMDFVKQPVQKNCLCPQEYKLPYLMMKEEL